MSGRVAWGAAGFLSRRKTHDGTVVTVRNGRTEWGCEWQEPARSLASRSLFPPTPCILSLLYHIFSYHSLCTYTLYQPLYHLITSLRYISGHSLPRSCLTPYAALSRSALFPSVTSLPAARRSDRSETMNQRNLHFLFTFLILFSFLLYFSLFIICFPQHFGHLFSLLFNILYTSYFMVYFLLFSLLFLLLCFLFLAKLFSYFLVNWLMTFILSVKL